MKKPALIAFLTFLVIPLHAADVSDLTFDASGDTITITDCDTGASGTLIIPGTIEGKPVTSIGVDAFFECEFLTSITIPEGVTSIGAWAFDDCYALRTVTIPDSVTSIGRGAFDECYDLLTVTIPEGVTSIGDWAFYCCYDLTSIIIPQIVTSIGANAFDGCINLTSITIPEGVTSIKEKTFLDCWSLTNITFLGNAPRIGFQAFHQVPANAKVYIYEGASGFSPEDGKFAGFSVVVRKNPFAGDTDKDGWKDETEVLFGSSPDNAKSVPAFKLELNVLEGDQLELLFPGEKGTRYVVQTSDDMKTWVTLTKLIIGQGNTISERFSISEGLGFYRIQRE